MVSGRLTFRAWSRVAAVLSLTAVVQVGILDPIVIAGAHPDAFLLIAVVAGLVAGSQQGAVIAFAAGLVADLFVLTPFGLSSLCYVLVAFGAGALGVLQGGRAPNGSRAAVAMVGGVVGTLVFAGLANLIDQPGVPTHQLVIVCAVVAISNVVLVTPAVFAVNWVLKAATSHDLAGVSGGSAAR